MSYSFFFARLRLCGKLHVHLELEPESDLPFAPRQHLSFSAEDIRLLQRRKDRRRVLPVQYVEELEQHLHSDALRKIDSLGKTHIEIHEWRRCESVSPGREIDPGQSAVAIRICCRSGAAEMETALRAKDAAELDLPGQLEQAVELKSVVDGQVRWSFVEIRAVHERSGRGDEASIRARVRAVCVRSEDSAFDAAYHRRNADEIICRQSVNAKLIVRLIGESVVAAQSEPFTEALREADDESIVSALVPWPERADWTSSEWRQKLSRA